MNVFYIVKNVYCYRAAYYRPTADTTTHVLFFKACETLMIYYKLSVYVYSTVSCYVGHGA